MTYAAKQVAVSTTPVAILTASAFKGARAVIVNGSVDVFVGGSDLTAANTATKGIKIAASGTKTITVDAGEVAYAVCATATGPTTLTLETSS